MTNPLKTAVIVLAAFAGVLAATAPAMAAPAGSGWHIVQTIDVPHSSLNDVVAFSNGTAWAGGQSPSHEPLLYQLTGTGWHSTTLSGSKGSYVSELSATSPTNVWAALGGSPKVAALTPKGWATATFSSSVDTIVINGIVTTGPSNTWAFAFDSTVGLAYALHFNGKSWNAMALPDEVAAKGVTGLVSASSPTNIWAIAHISSGLGALHYNGKHWQLVRIPKDLLPVGHPTFTEQILAQSPGTAWVTISSYLLRDHKKIYGPIVLLHYNGKTWVKTSGKLPSGSLTGPIASDGHGGLWLAGESPAAAPILLHYAAGRWTTSKAPASTRGALEISAIALIPGSRSLLGVADLGPGSDNGAAILRYRP